MKTTTLTLLAAVAALSLTVQALASDGKTIPVKCNNSPIAKKLGASQDPLSRAIRTSRPGDTLLISGTCEESVTITQGPLTLKGDGSGAISGVNFEPESSDFNGLITVDGARGVVISGLKIHDSPAEGVLAINGATVTIRDSVIADNQTGVRLSQSSMNVTDSEIRDQISHGIMAITGSTVVFQGTVDIHGNLGAGLFLEGNAMAELRGAQVHADHNFLGVIIALHSTLAVLELDSSVGSTLTARHNAAIGIQLGQGVLMVSGEGRPVASTLIDSSNNGGPGLLALAGSRVLSPFGAARFVMNGNPVGMILMSDASTEIRGGLEIQNNFGPGLVAHGSGVVMLRSVPDPDHPVPADEPSPSSIKNNGGPAVVADFGSRLDIRDVELVGPVICDPTVISASPVCL
jgi:hypothetical protein